MLNVEFFPRESHLVTFRDPWSFFALFHPACNNLVKQHLEDVAQKVGIAFAITRKTANEKADCRRVRGIGRVSDHSLLPATNGKP